MPQLTCIDPNEQAIDVTFESGETILQATYRAGVDGILAECGGGCSCATCHVILDANWDGTLDAPSVQETDMLSFAIDPTPHSRLRFGCWLHDQNRPAQATSSPTHPCPRCESSRLVRASCASESCRIPRKV